MTLVENAIRHGIDPSEDGGRIEVELRIDQKRCVATVRDTGIGLHETDDGCGTGLASLQERLQLAFGGEASVQITSNVPHGVVARIELPARKEFP